MKSSKVLGITAGLLLAACAGPNAKKPEPVAEAPHEDGYKCSFERVVGSNIPQKICTTQSERDAMHDDASYQMDKMRNPGGKAGSAR